MVFLPAYAKYPARLHKDVVFCSKMILLFHQTNLLPCLTEWFNVSAYKVFSDTYAIAAFDTLTNVRMILSKTFYVLLPYAWL